MIPDSRLILLSVPEQMWREAFQSVAEDIDRLTEEVGERIAKDPLATIGMQRPDGLLGSSSSSGKGPRTSRDNNTGSTAVHRTKRQRRQEKEHKVAAAALASSAGDPFERRRTRPTSLWSTHKAKVPEVRGSIARGYPHGPCGFLEGYDPEKGHREGPCDSPTPHLHFALILSVILHVPAPVGVLPGEPWYPMRIRPADDKREKRYA